MLNIRYEQKITIWWALTHQTRGPLAPIYFVLECARVGQAILDFKHFHRPSGELPPAAAREGLSSRGQSVGGAELSCPADSR